MHFDKCEEELTDDKLKRLELVQAVTMRWNSIYTMLKRATGLSLFPSQPRGPRVYAQSGRVVHDQGGCKKTASKVVLMTKEMMKRYTQYSRSQVPRTFAYNLSREILDNLNKRLGVVEEVKELSVATLVLGRLHSETRQEQTRQFNGYELR